MSIVSLKHTLRPRCISFMLKTADLWTQITFDNRKSIMSVCYVETDSSLHDEEENSDESEEVESAESGSYHSSQSEFLYSMHCRICTQRYIPRIGDQYLFMTISEPWYVRHPAQQPPSPCSTDDDTLAAESIPIDNNTPDEESISIHWGNRFCCMRCYEVTYRQMRAFFQEKLHPGI